MYTKLQNKDKNNPNESTYTPWELKGLGNENVN